jgi:hypothetical protein
MPPFPIVDSAGGGGGGGGGGERWDCCYTMEFHVVCFF